MQDKLDQCVRRQAARVFAAFLGAATLLPLGAAATSLAAVDQSLAQAVAVPPRGGSPLSDIVRRALVEASRDDAIQDALVQREALATALDQVAKTDDGTLDLAQAGLLVEVLQTLDSVRAFEKGRGQENALPALGTAIWRRYVAPAVAEAAAVRRVPLAPRATGEIAGQWLDGGRTVRAFDLWADERNRALAWSRIEFATPIPDAAKLIERSIVGPPPRKGAKLALYIDLSRLRPTDREAVLRTAEAASGNLAFVLDDLRVRMTACLDEKREGGKEQYEDQRRTDAAKASKASGLVAGRKAGPADEEEPDPRAMAEARCRDQVTIPGLNGQAVLFDPKRRIRVFYIDLTDAKAMLDRVISIAQVWP